TFARGHERFGRPTRGAFLLQPGELLARAQQSHLAVLAFEDVLERNPAGEATARIQRIVARKPELAARADPWLS
ncbi:MAG: hypothetical protein EBW58_08085, partial [Betaproteobacteria bacterium]|nr:hypothetical protein [Betaproteobacteria bacterium]